MIRFTRVVLITVLFSMFGAIQIAQAQGGLITWAEVASRLAQNRVEVVYDEISIGAGNVTCYAKVDASKYGSDIKKLTGFSKNQLMDDLNFAGEIEGYHTFPLGPGPCPPPGAKAGEGKNAYQPELFPAVSEDTESYPFPTWTPAVGFGLVLIFVLGGGTLILSRQRVR